MGIPASLVGATIGPIVHEVDERWTMAYAAAIGDDLACYFDTSRDGGVVAHPLFAVCPEWPVIVASRDALVQMGVPAGDVQRGVHATHDLELHRLVRAGDRLSTMLTITGVEHRRPGAFMAIVLETRDDSGGLVATTRQGTLHLGVPTDGEDDAPGNGGNPLPPPPTDGPVTKHHIEVSAGAAHVYTECARIWNPIHTDVAVARAAGLPGIILHGTATLAHAVSTIVREEADGDPLVVCRISGRFGAMVPMPSAITVRLLGRTRLDDQRSAVHFDVRNAQGAAAVDRGVVVLG